MRTVDEHVASALALVNALPTVQVPLALARSMVLAEPVIAAVDSPPFDNSAMDGFALRRDDAVGASEESPSRVSLVGEIAAGSPGDVPVEAGTTVRIMTGAPMPPGADAVVPLELAEEREGVVHVVAEPRPGAHIRRRGEDVTQGSEVLAVGTELAPAHLAAAAAAGVATVTVVRRPRVGILTTGDELVEPGQALQAGQIYDSNGVLIRSLVEACGGEAIPIPRVRDTVEAVRDSLEELDVDLIVTTGGVSVGAYDVVKAALAGAGVEFVKVAMQPGKPQGLGVLAGTPIVCVPGNPVSALVSFLVIAAPMMRVMRGLEAHVPLLHATTDQLWSTPHERQQYMPVRWTGPTTVVPATAAGSGSHLVASLAHAEALAIIPASVARVEVGDTVDIMRMPT